MFVAVVNVRRVCMRVPDGVMVVRVAVRPRWHRIMHMVMVPVVMAVSVFVCQCFVLVFMLV